MKSRDHIDLGKFNWKNRTILIAEDIYTSNIYFEAALKPSGANIIITQNGAQAVEYAKNNKVDLVLMDLQMPIMDGFEATRLIKQINKNIPIIVQTAYLLSGEKEKSYNAGCDEFIEKPIKLETLLSLVNMYLSALSDSE